VNKNKRMIAAKATTYAIFEGNLDASYSIYSSAASGTSSNNRFTMPVTVYDSLGNSYKINISFWKTDVTAVLPHGHGRLIRKWGNSIGSYRNYTV